MNPKSKQKTIRISTEHPIQNRILELAESGKPVKLKDGRYVIATDFMRELLIIGYQQVDDVELNLEKNLQKFPPKKHKIENIDTMTEPL